MRMQAVTLRGLPVARPIRLPARGRFHLHAGSLIAGS